ncbi:MAG TPA: ABC transporter permease [Gemmatimonadaceae bacterium]|nr:ABC transporter permease [Gemmatimonadaceae bacterium]
MSLRSNLSFDRLPRIVALRLRSLFRRDAVEQELDEELEYHIEQQTAYNIQHGMSPADARDAALRSIGGVAYRKEQVRDTRGTRWLDELIGDARFATRSLVRAHAFTATVVLTLALGIGANTAMFTLLRGTLLRPLPNRDGDRLVYLRQSAPGAHRKNVQFSVPEVADFRASSKAIAEFAEYSSAVPFTLVSNGGHPERARTAVISGNYFDVVGLTPVVGRLTNARDDGAAASPVAVLSYRYWLEHFAADPRVIGSTIRLNDIITTIVGVVQEAPPYPQPTDLFVNTVVSPHHLSATMVTGRTHRMSELFGRLAPSANVDVARREMTQIAATMFRDHPESYEKAAHFELTVEPLRAAVNERASLTFLLLMAAAGFVLLIACANVSNLTLMRGVGREHEMLIRAALGAGSGRLRRLLLVENLLLALVGGLLGVLVAFAGIKLLVGFAAQFSPRASEIRIDALVLAVGLATSLLAAVVLSFIPQIGSHRALAASLLPSGHRATLGRGRQRVQRSLVVAQIAVCVVLLTGAGLLTRTLTKLGAVETGVRTDHVLTLEMPLQGDLLREAMKQPLNLARYESIRTRVAALPGVDAASIGSVPPLRGAISFDVKAEGRAVPPNRATPHGDMKTVDPQFFATSGIPLIAGRAFASTDRRGSAPVVILSKSMARELFGDDDPVGRRVAFTGEVLKFTPFTSDWRTVVGVVGDTRDHGLESDPTATIYEPFAQELILAGALVVRTSADPATLQPMILRAIRDVSPQQLIEHVATIDQIRSENVAPRRLNAMFIAAFSALAVVIAMVGIAGVLGFSVRSRTSEIGIRMSLGADASRVRRMILGEGSVLLALGLAIGVSGALFATRVLRGFLFGITPHDPATLTAVAMTLVLVGVAACWLPAARAARVDPAVALRSE